MTSDVLNGAAEGLLGAIFFGGLSVAILWGMAWYRRRQGKSAPMKPVLLWMGIGALGCVALSAAGFRGLGVGALVVAAYWSWGRWE